MPSPRIFDAVFFDLDGTLLDTWPKLLETVNLLLQPEGITVTGATMQAAYARGQNLQSFIREHSPRLSKLDPDVVHDLFWDRYTENAGDAPLISGADAFLAQVFMDGLKTEVVTNKQHDVASIETSEHPVLSGIRHVFGAGRGVRAKPHPDLLLEAAQELRVPLDRVLFVGDSDQDFRAARAADVQIVLVAGDNEEKYRHLLDISGTEQSVCLSYRDVYTRHLGTNRKTQDISRER